MNEFKPGSPAHTACRSAALLLFVLSLSGGLAAQQKSITAVRAQPIAAEVSSLCDPSTTRTSTRRGQTHYRCEGKQPTPRPGGLSIAAPDGGGVRADINCSYDESGGKMTWTGCTCSENDDGNCTGFITWCAEQGDEVGGNSGSATCKPGG